VAIIVVAGVAGWICFHFYHQLEEQKQANVELQELAELDKQEMQREYEQFDRQYGELQKQLRNDSLIALIDQERAHMQELQRELAQTKATDAREIARLKKEIASLRQVLQSYIVQVDSLNRANESLRAENTEIKQQNEQVRSQITEISSERNQLRDQVDRAAQLDATGFWVSAKNKRGKDTQKVKDVKRLAFGFTIVKNVTASGGQRIVYARILKPDNSVFHYQGVFPYENTQLEYSEKKYIEYDGQEQAVTMYCDVDEFLEAGTYQLFIFVDKQMIGQTVFSLK
jgi:DNA repair exonuclease SbcCD ATPase subunit